MAKDKSDPLELDNLRVQPGDARWAVVPKKIRERRQQFVKVPWTWIERLGGAHGKTYAVAVRLLYLHWKGDGKPIKLANGMLAIDGISRWSKWRALEDLEWLGLIAIDRRQRKSPIITLVT
jgi:hypothetical protein